MFQHKLFFYEVHLHLYKDKLISKSGYVAFLSTSRFCTKRLVDFIKLNINFN